MTVATEPPVTTTVLSPSDRICVPVESGLAACAVATRPPENARTTAAAVTAAILLDSAPPMSAVRACVVISRLPSWPTLRF